MKPLAVLSAVIGLLGAPLQAQAQTPAEVQITFYGSPVMTQIDCALGLKEFKAAVVRGIGAVDVTADVRQSWDNYVVANYSTFTLAERSWLANDACAEFFDIAGGWEQKDAILRDMLRNGWAAGFAVTRNPLERSVRGPSAAQRNAPPRATPNPNPIAELERLRQNAQTVSRIGTNNVNNTITLMRTWSPPPRRP